MADADASAAPESPRVRIRQAREDYRFQRFLSRSFGVKAAITEADVVIEGYAFRGELHVINVRPRQDYNDTWQ